VGVEQITPSRIAQFSRSLGGANDTGANDIGEEQRNAKLLLTLILGPFEHVNGLYVYPGQRRSSPRRLAKIFDYDQ